VFVTFFARFDKCISYVFVQACLTARAQSLTLKALDVFLSFSSGFLVNVKVEAAFVGNIKRFSTLEEIGHSRLLNP